MIAAISDIAAERFDEEMPDIDKALAGTKESDMLILMSHRPINAQAHADKGVSLQLSGHTHGGQIIALNLLTKIMNQGFLMGLYKVDEMYLYLNRGTGLWGGLRAQLHMRHMFVYLDGRVLNKPEVIIPQVNQKVDVATGAITDEATRGFLQGFVDNFAKIAGKLAA